MRFQFHSPTSHLNFFACFVPSSLASGFSHAVPSQVAAAVSSLHSPLRSWSHSRRRGLKLADEVAVSSCTHILSSQIDKDWNGLWVILGVLLTERDPVDPLFGGGPGGLGQWLRHMQQSGEGREALHKSIVGKEMEEDEMLMALRIAVVCPSDLPVDRPSRDELVSMLTQLNSL